MKLASLSSATASVMAMNVNGRMVRRSRKRTEQHHDGRATEQRQRHRGQLPGPHRRGWFEPHRERRIVADRDAEDAAAGVFRRQGAARHGVMADRREGLARLLPQHLAAPAQRAARIVGRKPDHGEPRHPQPPRLQERRGAAVADGALDVAHPRVPVVAALVDEAETGPHRIADVDVRDPPRERGTLPDAIGRKRERAVGESLAAPAAVGLGIAALRRRIARVEFAPA